jgi:hypothetical protein
MSDLLRRLPAVRMALYRRAHPEVDVHSPRPDVWRAYIPLGGTYERVLAGPGLEELLDKLERAEAGG